MVLVLAYLSMISKSFSIDCARTIALNGRVAGHALPTSKAFPVLTLREMTVIYCDDTRCEPSKSYSCIGIVVKLCGGSSLDETKTTFTCRHLVKVSRLSTDFYTRYTAYLLQQSARHMVLARSTT